MNSTPWVNLALIAVNTLVFVATMQRLGDESLAQYRLDPADPRLLQFITYQFLHGSPMHLLGNMLFLYVFGNSVEDRLGKVGYLAFYLAGGVIAGLGHSLVEHAPVLGASGSVAAVTGAYLALFPLSHITIAYWFLFIGTFEVSGMMLILFQIAQNVFLQAAGGGGVAYLAHLCGYSYGFVVGMGMLWTRLLPREPYDMLAMYEQHRRRSKFRSLTRQGYQPWEAVRPGDTAPPPAVPASPNERALMDLRSSIAAEYNAHHLDRAAELYERLLEMDAAQVMVRQQQIDIANQLMSAERRPAAARAYELFLNTYRSDPQREQVELILALLYARYLDRRQRARELLTSALPRLHDAQQRALAQEVLGEIG